MLPISSIKIGQYQPTKSINTPNNNYPREKQTNIIGQYSYPAIYFMGDFNKIQRPTIKKETEEKLNSVYENYKSKLNETTQNDIENICKDIELNSKYSKKDILNAMQLVSQFGNYQSLHSIGKSLKENNIGFIPNDSKEFKAYVNNSYFKNTFKNNFGLNSSLYYCFLKKDLQKLDGSNIGIFIDNNKLDDIEKLSLEEINHITNRKNIKFFILSGFENGINFIDRSKDLKKETIKLLNYSQNHNMPVDKAIDNEIINRCQKIGIEPIIIRNKNTATIENIYKQLKPQQISKRELKAVIDATAINKFTNTNEQIECVENLTQYLENTLEVYTPERISKDLKKINSKINKQVKELGKTNEDIIYIIPESGKSYDLINYQYQKINNISKDKFITLKDENSITKDLNIDNKVLVILDDCSLSGSSLLEDENFNYYTIASNAKKNNSNIIFAPIYVSKEAEERIQKAIHKRKRNQDDFIIKTNTNEKAWNEGINNINREIALNKSILSFNLNDSKYCIVFPYMSPDNNSEFASNIAVFHNINYSKTDKKISDTIFTLSNIKTFFNTPEKIYYLANKILKQEND